MTARKGSLYTLIGDVIGSRQRQDRRRLQGRLGEVLDRVNYLLEPSIPLEPTLGDEFQGGFDDVATAVRASLMLRLDLLRSADIDTRYGLGSGQVEVFARSQPVSQDGPGWWTARDAIEFTRDLAQSPQTAFVRTQFKSTSSAPDRGEEGALNAFLLCRDEIVDRMKQPNRNRLYGLMRGWSQSRIADEEGATQGAVSQSLARSGAAAILAAQDSLEGRSR